MDFILEITLFTVLAVVVYQDIKMRLIHSVLPVLIFGLAIILNRNKLVYEEWLQSILFLVFNLVVVSLYFSLKKRTLINPLNSLIGWGDILFLIALVPLFTFRAYLIYFIMGMIFSLCLFLIMRRIYTTYNTVPL
ncbi:MAG: hypothetical protein GYB37_15715, partial [Algicola sp.]|nr:hypothetical protein [Algicola sp.]